MRERGEGFARDRFGDVSRSSPWLACWLTPNDSFADGLGRCLFDPTRLALGRTTAGAPPSSSSASAAGGSSSPTLTLRRREDCLNGLRVNFRAGNSGLGAADDVSAGLVESAQGLDTDGMMNSPLLESGLPGPMLDCSSPASTSSKVCTTRALRFAPNALISSADAVGKIVHGLSLDACSRGLSSDSSH
jgi:hypothetical protein